MRPTYEQRLALYRAFTRHPEYAHVRDDVLSWVVRQEMIVFYVLKEYLVFCVRYDPALHATLRVRGAFKRTACARTLLT